MSFIKSIFTMALASCLFFAAVSSLVAEPLPPHVYIQPGGYTFEASVGLRDRSSSEGLTVNLQTGRITETIMSVNGPVYPTVFFTHATCPVKGKIHSQTQCFSDWEGKNFSIKTDVPTSSKWKKALIELVRHTTRVYSALDPPKTKRQKLSKGPSQQSLSLRSIEMRPLHNYTLKTINAVYNKDIPHSRYSRWPRRVVVRTEVYSVGKKIYAIAKFYIKEAATDDDARSVIRFCKTKAGLKAISMLHVKRSSIWYPGVKEIVQRSIKRYISLERTHKEKFHSLIVKKGITNVRD